MTFHRVTETREDLTPETACQRLAGAGAAVRWAELLPRPEDHAAALGADLPRGWTPSILPFQVLAAFNIFYAMTLICGKILIAAGQAKYAMILSGVTMVLFLAAVTLATPYGITHAAAAGGGANLLALPLYLWRLRRHFGIDLMRCLGEQLPCLTGTIVMVSVVWTTETWMALHLPPLIQLIAASLVGAYTFMIVVILLARDNLRDIATSFSRARAPAEGALPDRLVPAERGSVLRS